MNLNNNTNSKDYFNRETVEENLLFSQISIRLQQGDALARHNYSRHQKITRRIRLMLEAIRDGRFPKSRLDDLEGYMEEEKERGVAFSEFYDEISDDLSWIESSNLPIGLIYVSPVEDGLEEDLIIDEEETANP